MKNDINPWKDWDEDLYKQQILESWAKTKGFNLQSSAGVSPQKSPQSRRSIGAHTAAAASVPICG